MADFSHLDEDGAVHMVDVGSKEPSQRTAIAVARVAMADTTRDALLGGSLPKGDALATVRIAAIQGAKRTSDLIPLCHPLALDGVDVSVDPTDDGVQIRVTARIHARTGVEMEAMTGAAVGALALYDMIKGVDRSAAVSGVMLIHKSGGKSGEWNRG